MFAIKQSIISKGPSSPGRGFPRQLFYIIERSWSLNVSGDVCVLETWSASGDELVSAFSVNAIAFSSEVGCGATWGVVGAFFGVEKISEVGVEYVEAVLLLQLFLAHQFALHPCVLVLSELHLKFQTLHTQSPYTGEGDFCPLASQPF